MNVERTEFTTDPFAGKATEYKREVARCLVEAFDLRAKRLTSLTLRSRVRRTSIMQCEICGQELDNSEDLAKHMEKMHATENTDKPEEKDASKASEEQEVPDPAPIPGQM